LRLSISALLAMLVLAAASSAQSLADAARANREQKEQSTAKATKIYTSDDLSPSLESELAAQGWLDPNQTPQQWKNHILAEKGRVRFYQSEVDGMNARQQAAAGASQQPAGTSPQATQTNDFLAQSAQRSLKRLGEEQMKLSILQQAARKAGMPSSIYDPSPKPRASHAVVLH